MNRETILLVTLGALPASLFAKSEQPNVIIIFTDDQGFEDLGCYGSPLIKTPNIDKMAANGLRLTDFYVSASVSSASRASLLTGKFNTHNGVNGVFYPNSFGMRKEQVTLAESLKEVGYTTACIGKWHLGDLEGHLPTDQGFDEYYGIPYSNDMFIGSKQKFADDVVLLDGYTMERALNDQKFVASTRDNRLRKDSLKYASPLFEGDRIVEYPCDQSTTTRRYFSRAIDFIDRCGDKPFFAYITPAMPHIPLYASEEFKGRSKRGLYGDCVEEIDHHVGRLLDHLKERGLDKNTIVIFASDNGPWLGMKQNGGSSKPFRDGKFSMYEGGVRVPCIMQWNGKIRSGVVSDAIISSIDIFPTVMKYADPQWSSSEVDGVDISQFLENTKVRVRDEYVYIHSGELRGVRKGDWVYLNRGGANKPKADAQPELYNLKADVSQKKNLYSSEPKKAKEMEALFNSKMDVVK